ncbi:MAG: hypothetical protein DMF77_02660 [Acidobacteria bacterium]|nr:MAG: hypothetical protein DMF77_02660 [Acidobacteriota bacterium]
MLRRTALAAGVIACLAGRGATGHSDGHWSSGESHDFGTVTQGEKVVHIFTLRNDEAIPLTIERVDLSDRSMAARFVRVIPPGKDGQIRVEWHTGQVAGEVEAEGVVRFAERTQPPLTFRLKGVVRPSIELLPYPAVFVSVFADESAERHVRIVNHEPRPLAITRAEGGGRHFAFALDTLEAGRVYDLRIQVPVGVPPGRYEEALYLDTDHPTRSRIPIAVNVWVKRDVYANPEVVDFGTVSLDELAQAPSLLELLNQTVLIKKREGEFEIKAVASDLAFLRISRRPAGKSGIFRIDVGLDRERLQPGEFTGAIRVATNDVAFPELVIRVRGEVR